jgi:phosphoglycolate phosphatase-like HAD superfamily hydrolase
MARIALGSRIFDIDLAAFDKDGTLIDFYHLWGRRARLAVDAVTAQVGGEGLAANLYRSIGYDPETGLAAANGPLAIASMPKLYTICAAVLYQHGLSWHDAEAIAHGAFAAALGALPSGEFVKPIGDVGGLFRRLHAAGIKIAIVTADDRAATASTLRLLGVEDLVGAMVCGNDPIPNKPAPDALLHLGGAFGVPMPRIMMVGDNLGDLETGTSAGIGCRVAVLSGTGQAAQLAPSADAVIASIDEIQVLD